MLTALIALARTGCWNAGEGPKKEQKKEITERFESESRERMDKRCSALRSSLLCSIVIGQKGDKSGHTVIVCAAEVITQRTAPSAGRPYPQS